MNINRLFLGIWLMLFLFTPASALNLQEGMHGMSWASSISQHAHLTKVRESGHVAYYVNSKMIYQVVNQSVTGVFYGFYQGQFFAVYTKLRTRDQFEHLISLFSQNYGKPKVEKDATGQNVVYRWKDGDVKIKVKMKEDIGDLKFAVYYAPISTLHNESKLEQIKLDAPGPTSSKDDKSVKSAPLLER
jgi:hypothetical protein